jgi:protein with PEP-CTERM/exosortase system signal
MKKSKFIIQVCCAMAFFLGLSLGTARANLLGASVNLSVHFPDINTVFATGSNVVVSAAVEYPTGSFPSYNPSWEINITDNQIIITDTLGTGFPYQTASFNGWVLTILSGPTIASASPNQFSQFNPVGLSVLNGNQLFLNYSGVAGPDFGTSIIDVTTTVPGVPDGGSTVSLLGCALLGLAALRRKLSC